MTTRPTSHLIHSGLLDIVSVIPLSQARPPIPRADKRSSKPENDLRAILKDDAMKSPRKVDRDKKAYGGEGGKRNSVEVGLRKRKIDKGMISAPTNFR